MATIFPACGIRLFNTFRFMTRNVSTMARWPVQSNNTSLKSPVRWPVQSNASLKSVYFPPVTLSQRLFSMFVGRNTSTGILATSHVSNPMLTPASVAIQPVRTRILYSRRGGNPRSVRPVIQRFFRLHNGLWIRPCAGRHKKRWTKTPARLHRLKQHVVCNLTQCQLLDKMVNKYYRMPKYYVDDPYAPYHRKSNLPDYRYKPPKFLP